MPQLHARQHTRLFHRAKRSVNVSQLKEFLIYWVTKTTRQNNLLFKFEANCLFSKGACNWEICIKNQNSNSPPHSESMFFSFIKKKHFYRVYFSSVTHKIFRMSIALKLLGIQLFKFLPYLYYGFLYFLYSKQMRWRLKPWKSLSTSRVHWGAVWVETAGGAM